jgi:ABC-type bacteriocin/lantibiotic exporter with double-glycine peptidase domain
MIFANCFHTDMTASAYHAEAPFVCADFASNKAIALILDAVIAASILIALITITLVLGLSVLLLAVVLVRLVLVVLLILEEVNRCRRRRTA